ncbi:MAG: aminopeptidase N [bacterium]|nr:aminopeptidase N [bacterium]
MNNGKPKTIYRKDYTPPAYKIPQIDLEFDLFDTETRITATMNIVRRNTKTKASPLELNGEKLKLVSLSIDGAVLADTDYTVSDSLLTIKTLAGAPLPENFTLVVKNTVNPHENKALEGLYKSGTIFCTQNEPEGFRKITWFIDRPDIMSSFSTKIIAGKKEFPVLLSNGNLTGSGDLKNGRHWAEWRDPFPKPCYLFALVAGDLGLVRDEFRTKSGRIIDLRIYCDKGNEEKCLHAMDSLKKSMKWDEERFDLEYDLDIYMIVAVDSFNMGAMENKGLNIFNSHYVLANQKTASDADFLGIERVIAHEYFHNWTGNRVTCRDWFQLTLKEGLTVFRDQEFSSDMQFKSVNRINDVNALVANQFIEDNSPMAHPIRPDSYMEINNFYTHTVYEKGAEVIRMIHTILGAEGFRKGMKKYFELYDGMAVTCDDFVYAMEEATGADLSKFKSWYSQTGTPVLSVSFEYNKEEKKFTINTSQTVNDPLHLPFTIGLLGGDGAELPLDKEGNRSRLLHIMNEKDRFEFEGIEQEPVVSLNRNFTAPVKIEAPYSIEDILFLFAHDTDDFNRWDAGQGAAKYFMAELVSCLLHNKELRLEEEYLYALSAIVEDRELDFRFKAQALKFPSEIILAQDYNPICFEAIHSARAYVVNSIGTTLAEKFHRLYLSLEDSGSYSIDPVSIGKRDLRLTCLYYLFESGEDEFVSLCYKHFENASNMTDEIGALNILVNRETPEREKSLAVFYDKWKEEILVISKWLSVQAASSLESTLEQVIALEKDPVFDIKIPNLVRALIGAFSRNPARFHDASGEGYKYLAKKIIEIDKFNPSISSALAGAFKFFPKVDQVRKNMMRVQLERIMGDPDLSKNTFEIVSKTLKG